MNVPKTIKFSTIILYKTTIGIIGGDKNLQGYKTIGMPNVASLSRFKVIGGFEYKRLSLGQVNNINIHVLVASYENIVERYNLIIFTTR